MAQLTGKHQVFIVSRFACGDLPSEIVRDFLDEFGIEITRQQAESYDASKDRNRKGMRKDLVDLFDKVRADFDDKVEEIPIAKKTYRLRELQKLYNRQKSSKNPNPVLMQDLIKQAAMESGGMFTNRRELTGKDGTPLAPPPGPSINLADLSDEELNTIEAAFERASVARADQGGEVPT